jgi:glycosyltransferase involved in cell wall biosynthesis
MRSLVVTRWVPWPPTSGSRQRSATIIDGLRDLGPVDVFLHPASHAGLETTPPDGVRLLGVVPRETRRVRRLDRVVTAAPWARPPALRHLSVDRARQLLAARLDGPYDLAWFVRPDSWLSFGDLVEAPAIVDYDDLQDRLLTSRRRSSWPHARREDVLGRWATTAEAAAWNRLQRRLARDVAAVTVCSDADRAHLGVDNAVVVINGVDLPDTPAGRVEVSATPTICFHGSLDYRPNADAARRLVDDVFPELRASVPSAVVRLVGRHDRRVAPLDRPPEVVVTGFVPDITTELARADVIAVPLREGAGTRIKVLEALAHRVPVVSTSLGVEGLDVEHGRHLLVADDPRSFAAACAALLTDTRLRGRLAAAGAALVAERYRSQQARQTVVDLARKVVASGRRVDRGPGQA